MHRQNHANAQPWADRHAPFFKPAEEDTVDDVDLEALESSEVDIVALNARFLGKVIARGLKWKLEPPESREQVLILLLSWVVFHCSRDGPP